MCRVSNIRHQADRGHRQPVARHLLPGGGARLSGQRGGQRPAQRQDRVHLRPLHAGHDAGGRGEGVRERPAQGQTQGHQVWRVGPLRTLSLHRWMDGWMIDR